MKQVIAMHGWCSDSTYWERWENHFQTDAWFWQSANRGYGSKKSWEPIWKEAIPDRPIYKKIIICHSFGIHLMSSKHLKEASHVVLINSFSRFIPNGRESRAIKAALFGMRQHIGEATEQQMINKFYLKANFPHQDQLIVQAPFKAGISSQGRQKLKIDLEVLINSKQLPIGLNPKAKVLVIDGAQDQIIGSSTKYILIKDLQNQLDKYPLHWRINGEGHFIQPSKLIKRVKSWLIETS